jgi:hypothetical protein
MTEDRWANIMKLVRAMTDVCKGEPHTDICNAALYLGVAVAVKGGATADMVVAVVHEVCAKLNAERSN